MLPAYTSGVPLDDLFNHLPWSKSMNGGKVRLLSVTAANTGMVLHGTSDMVPIQSGCAARDISPAAVASADNKCETALS